MRDDVVTLFLIGWAHMQIDPCNVIDTDHEYVIRYFSSHTYFSQETMS